MACQPAHNRIPSGRCWATYALPNSRGEHAEWLVVPDSARKFFSLNYRSQRRISANLESRHDDQHQWQLEKDYATFLTSRAEL